MDISLPCISCMIAKTVRQLQEYPPETARKCLNEVLAMMSQLEPGTTAPLADFRKEAIIRKYFPKTENLSGVKQHYNQKMMELLPQLREQTAKAADPLALAIALAIAGNYIDFGTMDRVEEDQLDHLLEEASSVILPAQALTAFKAELAVSGNVVYLHDNCGEIVLDKLLLEQMDAFDVKVTSIVRGAPVINDATVEDAAFCGIDAIGNGSSIAGTDLKLIGEEAAKAIREADMIISKGQANFETLYGNGLPVWYLFLCKCDYFSSRFGLEKFKPVFAHENQIGQILRRRKECQIDD